MAKRNGSVVWRGLAAAVVAALPLLLSACGGGYAPPAQTASMHDYRGYLQGPPLIRVLLKRESGAVALRLPGGWEALAEPGGERLAGREEAVEIQRAGSSLAVNGRPLAAAAVTLRATAGAPIAYGGASYRGQMRVEAAADGRLAVVSHVSVEDALPAVLAGEVIPSWPTAALEAQAVAARTYLLNRKKTERGNAHDAVAGVHMAYPGVEKETRRLREAVQSSSGLVMLRQGAVFPAFFHTVCGGHTEDAEYGFGPSPESDFMAGVPCRYCAGAPHSNWTLDLPLSTVRAQLRQDFPNLGEIRGIKLISPGLRARAAIVEHAGGRVSVLGARFRALLGPDLVKSTYFTATISGDTLHLEGHGWGHGVGLCQYGALGMARAGHAFDEILLHYFRGVEIARIY